LTSPSYSDYNHAQFALFCRWVRHNTKNMISTVGHRRLVAFLGEVALVLVGYFAYSFSKTLIHDDPGILAFRNALDILYLEQNLGVFFEFHLQQWFLGNAHAGVYCFNWLYTLGYWPVILPAAIVLWWKNPATYIKTRNIAFIALGIVLFIYAIYPVAPPRMLPGFVDTLESLGPHALQHASDALLANPFAAMPSVHFGLVLLVSLLLIRTHSLVVKLVGLSYLGLMALTIIVTGNHYFLDILGAIGVVGTAFLAYNAVGSVQRWLFVRVRRRSV